MEDKELEHPLLNEDVDALKADDAFTKASIWNKLTFGWLNPLFSKGHKQKLKVSDIPSFPQSEMANNAYSLLEESLDIEKTQISSLGKAIFYAIWKPLACNAFFAGVYAVASYTGPLSIANFVHLLSDNNGDMKHYGMFLCFIFSVSKTAESISERQWYFGANKMGIRVRAAVLALIYKKLLLVKSDGARNGKVVNYINTDIEKVVELIQKCQQIWLLPVQVILALLIWHKNLGWIPSILAILTTALIMLSNTPVAKLHKRLHTRIMDAKDSRIKATSEILKSIKVLKLHAWEFAFLEKLLLLREIERGWLMRFLYTKSAAVFLYWASPMFITVMTFGVCTILEKQLSSGSIFSTLAALQILHERIYHMPEVVSAVAQARISIKRLQEFLREQNQEVNHPSETKGSMILLSKGEYAWEPNNKNVRQHP